MCPKDASTRDCGLHPVDTGVETVFITFPKRHVIPSEVSQAALEILETLGVVRPVAKPEGRRGVQELGAVQEHLATVGGDVEVERGQGDPLAIGRDAHGRVHRVVHEGGCRMPHVLVDPGQPHKQGTKHPLERHRCDRLVAHPSGPLRDLLEGAAYGRDVPFHQPPPPLHQVVCRQGLLALVTVAVVPIEPALDHRVVEVLHSLRAVVPAPEPDAVIALGRLRGGGGVNAAHTPVARHVHVRQHQGELGDRVVDELQLLVIRERGKRELGRFVREEELEIVVCGLHRAVYEGVEQAADGVRGIRREGVDAYRLEGCRQLEVQVLDVEDQVGHAKQRGYHGLLGESPPRELALREVPVRGIIRVVRGCVAPALIVDLLGLQSPPLVGEPCTTPHFGITWQGRILAEGLEV
mmetsp:Transcript_42366/g.119813  ORF Transcript_42366/g.119813 Transcript_42366/m.119813 type:complete len:409 (+) Transcript_42366:279-1505(+)